MARALRLVSGGKRSEIDLIAPPRFAVVALQQKSEVGLRVLVLGDNRGLLVHVPEHGGPRDFQPAADRAVEPDSAGWSFGHWGELLSRRPATDNDSVFHSSKTHDFQNGRIISSRCIFPRGCSGEVHEKAVATHMRAGCFRAPRHSRV